MEKQGLFSTFETLLCPRLSGKNYSRKPGKQMVIFFTLVVQPEQQDSLALPRELQGWKKWAPEKKQ
jgi:hypothetical protein